MKNDFIILVQKQTAEQGIASHITQEKQAESKALSP
jgi:hypothetical protein